jgi:hypothetical protein
LLLDPDVPWVQLKSPGSGQGKDVLVFRRFGRQNSLAVKVPDDYQRQDGGDGPLGRALSKALAYFHSNLPFPCCHKSPFRVHGAKSFVPPGSGSNKPTSMNRNISVLGAPAGAAAAAAPSAHPTTRTAHRIARITDNFLTALLSLIPVRAQYLPNS